MKTIYFLFVSIIILSGYIRPAENTDKIKNSSGSNILAPKDTKNDLINLLNNLIAGSNVDLFRQHCSSIINVISSTSKYTDYELSFLEAMYKTFYDTTIAWNACKLSTYTQRKRPFIISWESPTDGEVSVAWLLLPENWDPGKTYPLYTSLHGLYEPYSNEIEYMTRYFRPDSIVNKSFEDGYTLFPWGRGNLWYEGISETDVWESIDAVEKLVKVNPARKYLMGHSMGGYGTWSIAGMNPEPWAAIGIMAGALWYNSSCLTSSFAEYLKYTPVYIVVGTQDGLYSNNITAYNLLQKIGNPNIEFVTFPGGHESLLENWENMYNWLKNFSKDSLTSVKNTLPPDHYTLFNSYPNPFNPVTTISYSLPEVSSVKIEIYNMLGQKIIKLIDRIDAAGTYQVNWNAQSLSGGVYFCKLKAVQVNYNKVSKQKVFEKMQKLLLLK